ncbi:MAG: hypothetical protein HY028_01125 [Gammaproteobacteria bacterium]|nr:hypothetical protein [Gammaproteobacteria bacterium]
MTKKAKVATSKGRKALSPKGLWNKKSRFQTIELVEERGGLLLKLNGWPQVHSKEEAKYHENVATMPMMLAQKVDRCVILGGGDGLAARNILRFRDVKKLTQVELDPGVIKLCSEQPDFVRMNEDVFHNPRLELIVGDAIEWFLKAEGPFDVIINDIEVMFTKQPQKMTLERHFQLFEAMADKLAPGGVAVVTVPDDFDDSILQGFFEIYGDYLPYETRQAFMKSKNVFARARVLLATLFPYVMQWTIRFPVLGPHTTFYLSHRPMTRLRRSPNPPAKYIKDDMITRVLK